MGLIDKNTIKKLAELARLELSEKEEDSLRGDLDKILSYFEELKEVNTDSVAPMSGGTFEKNVYREDKADLPKRGAIDSFPESEKGFLKVPPVFE